MAGDLLTEKWQLKDFVDGSYDLAVYGPNGFFREFKGDKNDPIMEIDCMYEADPKDAKRLTGNVSLGLRSTADKSYPVEIVDHAYGAAPVKKAAGWDTVVILNLEKSFGWYDFSVKVEGLRISSVAMRATSRRDDPATATR